MPLQASQLQDSLNMVIGILEVHSHTFFVECLFPAYKLQKHTGINVDIIFKIKPDLFGNTSKHFVHEVVKRSP